MTYDLKSIAQIVGGTYCGSNNIVSEIAFDSRSVFDYQSSLFISIKGNLFDGASFIPSLQEKGVKSFLVSNDHITENSSTDIGYVKVSSPLAALQKLAAFHRQQHQYPIIAVTGSNGKSIVKEWIFQLLDQHDIFRSPKSYNSQLGVALSLMMLPDEADFAVIEAGISQPEEMSRLEAMIKPNIVILTNIGDAHGENFNSREEKLKEKLLLAKNADTIIYSSTLSTQVESLFPKEKRFVWGYEKGVDLQLLESEPNIIKFIYKGVEYTPYIPFKDQASRENIIHIFALAAVCGYDLSEVVKNTKNLSPVAMRMELINGIGGSKIINDCYNSDFNSLGVALSYLTTISSVGKKILILSDILESGLTKKGLYNDVATLINNSKVDKTITIGTKIGVAIADKINCQHSNYLSTEEFLQEIDILEFASSNILIKGARSFGLERITRHLEEKQHLTVMEVNTNAIIHNYKYFRSLLSPETKMVAMVKALSYGCGPYEVALTLQNNGIDYLAVAYIDEGITLRTKGITTPIIILNSNPSDYAEIIKYMLEPEIYSLYSLRLFIKSCRREGVNHYPIHIKLDTGMHRMGFENHNIEELKDLLSSTPEIRVASIFSHLSSSDTPELDSETKKQIDKFDKMSSALSQDGTIRHICNSAGIIRYPEAHFDMVRLGLGLYGMSSFCEDKLMSVNSLHTRILQIKNVSRGEYVGYNMRGVTDKDICIATLAIGYADGLNRKLSCGAWSVTINGEKAPIVGNISMDTCAVDITGIDCHEGDMATIFADNKEVNEIAEILGTIPYEVLTSVSSRIKRIYFKE